MQEQVATPTDATPAAAESPQSFDDKLLAKFGLGEPEETAPEPEATPAEGEEQPTEEAEAENEEVETPQELAELEIKHNGETRRVPKDEAIRLAQMGYDYEFKMQRLNGDAQRLQGMAQALQARQALQAQHLDALVEAKSFERQLQAYANIDWVAEASGPDPVGAWQKRMQFDQLKDAYAHARYRAEQAQQPLNQAEAHYDQERMALENEKLLQRVPEWKDEAVKTKEAAAIREAMTKTYGFAPEEIGGPILSDHRAVALIRDAVKYRQAIAAKKGPPQGLPKTLKPGVKAAPRTDAQSLGDIKRGLRQVQSKDARKALEDELIARKFGLK